MTYYQLVKNIRKSGLTIKEFASLIKISPTAITNYSKADRIPNHLAIISTLICEMETNNIDFKQAIENISASLLPVAPKIKGRFGGDKQDIERIKE